jgi:hypothetical protein
VYVLIVLTTKGYIFSSIVKNQDNLAQRNPTAFFEELKTRLLARMIDDDPYAILDLQIAKTINDDDDHFPRYDSGVGTDSSEKLVEYTNSQINNFPF